MNVGNADARVRDTACALAVDAVGDVVIAGNTEGALFDSTGQGGVLCFWCRLGRGEAWRAWRTFCWSRPTLSACYRFEWVSYIGEGCCWLVRGEGLSF